MQLQHPAVRRAPTPNSIESTASAPARAPLSSRSTSLSLRRPKPPALMPPAPREPLRTRPGVALVTGATSAGIGKEVLKQLLAVGWEVISIARPERVAEHEAEFAGQAVQVRACDCANIADIKALAASMQKDPHCARLDLMVHSLGVMRERRCETAEGHELNLAVNAIAPWLLTREMMPQLLASGRARVIQVSSAGLSLGKLDVDDLETRQQPYEDFRCYFTSKLVNLHLMSNLQRSLGNSPVAINLVHPGFVRTELGRNLGSGEGWEAALKRAGTWFHHNVISISAADAAKPVFAAATEERLGNLRGAYLEAPGPLKRLGATLQQRDLAEAVVSRADYDASLEGAVVSRCTALVDG